MVPPVDRKITKLSSAVYDCGCVVLKNTVIRNLLSTGSDVDVDTIFTDMR